MAPRLSIRSTFGYKNSYPDPTSVKYSLIVYKTDDQGRIIGKGTYDLENNQFQSLVVYRFDAKGNNFAEICIGADGKRSWKLNYYSQCNLLVCQQGLWQSDGDHELSGEERHFFYDPKGGKSGWETVQGLEGIGLMRTLHKYSVEKHAQGKLYKDYYLRNGVLEDSPNEYFIENASKLRVEYGETPGQNVVPREYRMYDSNGLETECKFVSSNGDIWRLEKNETYDSLAGLERYQDLVNEFEQKWASEKDAKIPKQQYETTKYNLEQAEALFGLRTPFLHPEYENDYSDLKLLSEIGEFAEQADAGDPGGKLLAKIEQNLKILEPRLYYRLTKFKDELIADLYLKAMDTAMESEALEKVMRYGRQAREFNQGKDPKIEAWACMNVVSAALDRYHVTKEEKLLRETNSAYLTLEELLMEGHAPKEAALLVFRFKAVIGDLNPQSDVSEQSQKLKPEPDPSPKPYPPQPEANPKPPKPDPKPPLPEPSPPDPHPIPKPKPWFTKVMVGAIVLVLVVVVLFTLGVFGPGKLTGSDGGEAAAGSGSTEADSPPDLRTSEGVVKGFVYYLGQREYRKAYDLGVDVPAWRSFAEFSAPSGFGGIDSSALHRMNEFRVNADRTKYEVEVFMRDPINGDGTFVQEFDLGFIESWKILGHRTLSSDRPQDNFKFEVKAGKHPQSDGEILEDALLHFPKCRIQGNAIVGCRGSDIEDGSPEETTVGLKHYFKQKGNTRGLVMLQTSLSGLECNGEMHDAYHAESGFTSAALYELQDGNWVTLAFEKQIDQGGGWGMPGDIGKPLQFGLENVAVPVHSGYMGQGTLLGGVTYIGVIGDQIRAIASFQNSVDDSGNNGTVCWQIKESFLKRPNVRFYPLRLERSNCDGQRSVSSKSVEIELGDDGKYHVPAGFDE